MEAWFSLQVFVVLLLIGYVAGGIFVSSSESAAFTQMVVACFLTFVLIAMTPMPDDSTRIYGIGVILIGGVARYLLRHKRNSLFCV